MSDRVEALRAHVLRRLRESIEPDLLIWDGDEAARDFQTLARAICEHLGLSWEDEDDLRGHCEDWSDVIADKVAALLEAAGIEDETDT